MYLKNKITSLIIVFCMCIPYLSIPTIAKEPGGSEILETENASQQKILLKDGFENGLGRTNSIITGYKLPAGWTFEDSRNPITYELNAGITSAEKASGESALAIEAVDRNSAGFISRRINVTNETPAFDITVKIKNSAEYVNNCPKYILYFCWDDKTVGSVVLEGLSTSSEEWIENVTRVDYTNYPYVKGNYNSTSPLAFNNVKLKLLTAYHATAGTTASGTLYYDDLIVKECYDDIYTVLDVRSDVLTGWYNLGDTVTYKPVKELPDTIYEVKATLHDSYGDVIYENVLSAEDFEKSGWVYTPKKYGHYSVGFTGKTNRGDIAIVSAWKWPHNTKPGTFVIKERSFVVAKETKPMSERNNKLTYASHYPGLRTHRDYPDNWEIVYEMHDLVGFGGIRVHAFSWATESYKPYTAPNPGKGLYDWTDTDKFMKLIGKYNFDVWATVLYTPEWASRLAGSNSTNTRKGAVQSITDYMATLPSRMEYYNEYLTQLSNRYGDEICVWEIWNETNENNVFLSKATPQEYVYLLKHAYTHLKEIQPDDMVIMGGMVKEDSTYYGELLDAGIYDYTDHMVMHNKYTDWYAYQAEETKRGYEIKPWANGEAHYNLFDMNDDDLDLTERELALELLKGYFWDLRGGVERVALYQLDTDYDYESLPYMMSINQRALSFGLWRKRPFLEPRISAIALHTFFDKMGKDFKYTSEYSFEGGTVAMNFLNDGEPLLAVWNTDTDAEMPKELKACMTDKTVIVDWENNVIDADDKLRQETVYFVTGLDNDMLASIPKSEQSVVKNLRRAVEQVSTHVGNGNAVQLFDEKTFVEAKNINWIDTGWSWVSKVAGEEQKDFGAKFAVSLNEKGLYLMIDVDDNTPYFVNDKYEALYNTDSVQIGIDVTGEGYSDMRTEIDVALANDEVTIYKRASANVFGSIPTGWTGGGATMESSNARITASSGKIHYKIFIPASEMFPFKYDPDDKDWRMSLVINDNDGTKRRGLVKWADGIDGGKNVGKYGKIVLP